MLEKTWRWFGAKDSVTLANLKEMGVEGVVTALHHIKNGEVWTVDEILAVKREIESYGMRWSVVESLPVSEGIKIRSDDYPRLVANYRQSLRNLGTCGIDTVCYNFMPVLDWARTNLHFTTPSGGESMLFDLATFAAFDLFVLNRPNGKKDYPSDLIGQALQIATSMSEEQKERLAHNIIIVTQGFINGALADDTPDYKQLFLDLIARYHDVDETRLREHLRLFLQDIIPTAEESGVRLCIHPDDPPFSILGLPRIAKTIDDFEWIVNAVPSPSNGITFCAGSLSARSDNDVVEFARRLAPYIHFSHLRNTCQLADGAFYESGHLSGSVDMGSVVEELLLEQQRRTAEGRTDLRMPFRPDHGLKILDDHHRSANPGYPLIGRLKGLAEIDGLQHGLERKLMYST